MNNEKKILYLLKDFEEEEKMKLFLAFKNRLNLFFPKIKYIRTEWPLPENKYFSEETGRVDLLGFYSSKKGNWGGPVLCECKWSRWTEKKRDRGRDPVHQIKDYLSLLEETDISATKLWAEYKKYLQKNDEADTDEWELGKKKINKEIWEKTILVCMADFGYFSEKYKKEARDKGIILVEVQKYENSDKARSVLVWIVEGDHERLGIDSEKIIIQIPKEEEEEKSFVKKKLALKKEENLKIEPEEKNDIDQKKKEMDINQFLKVKASKIDKWSTEKIRELDEHIRLSDSSIWGKEVQKYKYFSYYKKKSNRPLLFIRPRVEQKGFEVFLRKSERLTGFDSRNNYKGNETSAFERMILVKNKLVYKQLFKKVNGYLKEVIKSLKLY